MKIALIISGYLRSFKNNIESLRENLLNLYDVDVYIYITNCDEIKYTNNSTSLDFIHEALKPKAMIVSDNFSFKNKYNDLYNQNYKFYIMNKKRKEVEKNENIHYDVVMKFRPDVYLKEKINFKTDINTIFIPKNNLIDKNKLTNIDDNYICDIIAYGSPTLMDKYFDLYSNIDNLVLKHGNVNETITYHYLIENNIKFELVKLEYIVILSLINTIAITGDSGVGKSRLSDSIKGLFNSSFVLECDRYHKWERGNENWNNLTHLNPEANFLTKMNDDVFDLKIGNNIFQIDYDHNTGKFTDKQTIESRDNIIVCGLHSFYMTNNTIDLKIYIDADDNVKIPWKIKRDINKRGYSYDKIIKQINDRKNDYDKYILPQKYKADIVILFFSENNFDINNFKIDDDIEYKFKIGINKQYCLKTIIKNLEISNIELDDNFYNISFQDNDFNKIIQSVIISFFNL